jgi:hypothetical protein
MAKTKLVNKIGERQRKPAKKVTLPKPVGRPYEGPTGVRPQMKAQIYKLPDGAPRLNVGSRTQKVEMARPQKTAVFDKAGGARTKLPASTKAPGSVLGMTGPKAPRQPGNKENPATGLATYSRRRAAQVAITASKRPRPKKGPTSRKSKIPSLKRYRNAKGL